MLERVGRGLRCYCWVPCRATREGRMVRGAGHARGLLCMQNAERGCWRRKLTDWFRTARGWRAGTGLEPYGCRSGLACSCVETWCRTSGHARAVRFMSTSVEKEHLGCKQGPRKEEKENKGQRPVGRPLGLRWKGRPCVEKRPYKLVGLV